MVKRRGWMVFLLVICIGCASSQGPADPDVAAGPDPAAPTASAPDPADPTAPPPRAKRSRSAGNQTTAHDRLSAAIEGMVLGAVAGGTVLGPYGAAAGGVAIGIYSAVTGQVPISGGGGGPRTEQGRDREMEEQIEDELEREIAKQDTLEDEIQAELRRQEELLKQIERQDAQAQVASVGKTGGDVMASADPRQAPAAPKERDLPASIFEESKREVAAGAWGNAKPIEVLERTLDADRDGKPEEVRYHDEKTGAIVRKEEDRDYDGRIDSWTRYEAGIVASIERDNDADGKVDEWQQYGHDGLMSRREVDRNSDGVRDAFYTYEAGALVREEHDGDSNGKLDRIVHYQGRKLVRSEEDGDRNGVMDTWTQFQPAGDHEVISRVERDTTGDGKPDTFETYQQVAGKTEMALREEDKNGDGKIDVKSVYQNGKLKTREISDSGLQPL
jgi:antitoxin component YwqK of YwqJK toxin-antitoxin module